MEGNYDKLLQLAKTAAVTAGEQIMKIYLETAPQQIELKKDNSPLTVADKKAHEIIKEVLSESNLPMLSEEGKTIPYEIRKHWNVFWMVDPLDGTKEFLKRNGEFTVNIALIQKSQPVLGVVYIPVSKQIYWAIKGSGGYSLKGNELKRLQKFPIPLTAAGLRVIASRTHLSEATEKFIHKLHSPVLINMGSSLKFMVLAENKADIYPRFSPTMEWDTAAAQIIVEEAGLNVIEWGNKAPLKYNKENLVNPWFLVS